MSTIELSENVATPGCGWAVVRSPDSNRGVCQ